MVNFEEHFWGDKYNGFEVLQHNFKLGTTTGKEFAEFLKERSSIEETYSKSLLKLANKCASANLHVGTFEPCWKFLQSSTEKLANVHNQIIQNLNDVSKSVRDYGELQKEKQKLMKDDFASTTEAVLNLQNLSAALIKARELYQQRSQEVERCRKDLTNLKDIRNAELKFKKSTDDYKQLVDKRETARKDYCTKMTVISQKLQVVEEEHLTQMLEILAKYGESLKTERFLLDQIIEEFNRNMVELTVENLLQQFLNLKQTGRGCPLPVDFEETNLQTKPVDLDAMATQLKEEKKKRKTEKREKKFEFKRKKEKAAANGTVEGGSEEGQENQDEVQIDAEGYVIRPQDSDSLNSGKHSRESCSSDSDSEDSDDERQKIKVRIKPVEESHGSNSNLSQEELKKLSATLTLMSPSTVHQKMSQLEDKKFAHGWGSDGTLNKQAYKSKSNIDLLNMDQNSDTASIHSLPVNSSFPALNTTEEMSEIGMPSKQFGKSNTSSPLASPPNGNNCSGGSGSLSPSTSFDKSTVIKSLDSIDKSSNDDLDAIDIPPPLPAKSRTLPLRSATNCNSSVEEIDSKENSLLDISPLSSLNDNSSKSDENREPSPPLPSDPVINDPPEKKRLSTSLSENRRPVSTVTFPSLEALKPPPSEKRQSPLTLPLSGITRNNTAVPRPKPGQLMSIPPSRHTVDGSSSLPSSVLPAGSSSAGSSTTSFFSDLKDINFSSLPPPLSTSALPVANSSSTATLTTSLSSSSLKGEKEESTSPWGDSEKSPDPDTSPPQEKATEQDIMSTWVIPDNNSSELDTLSTTKGPPELNISTTIKSPELNVSSTIKSPELDASSKLKSPDSNVSNTTKGTDLSISSTVKNAELHITTVAKNAEFNVPNTIKQELISEESNPPIVPRRSAFQITTPASVTAASTVNLSPVDRAIPIAVAFIETVNGVFKGCDEKSCVIKVTGDMTISFPANIVSMLSNNPQPPALTFLVTGTTSLEQIFPNKQLVERGGQLPGGKGMLFKFNMLALAAYLKKQAEQGTKSTYYNIDILKYQVRCYGISSAPLQLSSYWRCDPEQTDLKIDYTYNDRCMSSPVALNNVSVVVPVDGGVEIMQSKPTAIWSSEHQRCMWKIPSIFNTADSGGSNALRARFDITRGPSTQVPIAVQFTGEGSTISSLNFDLTSPAYKLSLVKKRFTSGKYMVEAS